MKLIFHFKGKKSFLVTFIFTFLLLNLYPAFADTEQAGLEIPVLESGVGARALGMGSAFTAISDNADAPYWNPAGLSQMDHNEITAMQTKLSTDADHYYVSYAAPFMGGAFGISWIQVSTGAIPQTLGNVNASNEVTTLGIFSYYSNAYLLAYGHNITDNLSFGITAKYLTSDMPGLVSIEGASAFGYSLTPGLLYKPFSNLSIGLTIDELINYQKWGTDEEERAPSQTRLGLAYRTSIFNLPLLLSGDVTQVNMSGYVAQGGAGAELTMGQIAFRAGYVEDEVTAGAGFTCEHVKLDYAYVTQTALTKDNVHRVSLTGMW